MSETGYEPVVGIEAPGEMGTALGQVIVENGFRVVTTLEGRSNRTGNICREAGLEVLESFSQVVGLSDVFISLVPPTAAVSVAEKYRDQARSRTRTATFVDANAISPQTAVQIADIVSQARAEFVDGSIHGLAVNLRKHGTIYLSGKLSGSVASFFGKSVQVKVLGTEPGRASMMKMLLGGVSKGMVALFLEMSLIANETKLLDEMIEGCREYYPGFMTAIDRLLPTYPRHALRRGEEMKELERAVIALGLQPSMICGARQTISSVGVLNLEDQCDSNSPSNWTIREIIEHIAVSNPFSISNRQTVGSVNRTI